MNQRSILDVRDPRDPNCQEFRLDDTGRVVGVRLGIEQWPSRKYALDYVTLIPEQPGGGGTTVAEIEVVDATGARVREQMILAWPWRGDSSIPWDGWTDRLTNNEHVISGPGGHFDPYSTVGPLCLLIGAGNVGMVPISDVLYGLGLPAPKGQPRHVSFFVRFKERGSIPGPEPEPEPEPSPEPGQKTEIIVRPGQEARITIEVS